MRSWIGLVAVGAGALALSGLAYEMPSRTIAEFSTPLSGREANQRHNAELCSARIDGTVIRAGAAFSFNETVGPWSRDRGYRRAPVSYSGQMIDAWGGGVCQTSTTVYNAALLAGFDVNERSAHHYAPTYIEPGRDAAVAYPNIDLVFVNPYPVSVTLRAEVDGDRVRVWFEGQVSAVPEVAITTRVVEARRPRTVEVGTGGRTIVRNIGKPGFEVETTLERDGALIRLSTDRYEVMNRVLERSDAQ